MGTQWLTQEGGGVQPPPEPENCCRKMMLFPTALFLAKNFHNNRRIPFSIAFSPKIFKVFSKFPKQLCFSSKREEIFCKFSRILWRPGGYAPRPHYEAGHNLEPPEIFSCVRHCGDLWLTLPLKPPKT